MSLSELSIALECSSSRLRWYLDQLGIKKKKRLCQNEKILNEMIHLYTKENWTTTQLSEKYGIERSTIRKNFIKKEIPRNSRKLIVDDEFRKKVYKNKEFMKKVNDLFEENKKLFTIYAHVSRKNGFEFTDIYEYLINEFYKYCVTEERLSNFKKYSLRNWLMLTRRSYEYHYRIKNGTSEFNKIIAYRYRCEEK